MHRNNTKRREVYFTVRGAERRELSTSGTGTNARVLASARTVTGATVVIFIVRGAPTENPARHGAGQAPPRPGGASSLVRCDINV